jgi:hypothetical protein
MPLYPGGPRFGLGLWNTISGTLVVEILMFATGVWLYVRSTCARDRIGQYGFLAYVVYLCWRTLVIALATHPQVSPTLHGPVSSL